MKLPVSKTKHYNALQGTLMRARRAIKAALEESERSHNHRAQLFDRASNRDEAQREWAKASHRRGLREKIEEMEEKIK